MTGISSVKAWWSGHRRPGLALWGPAAAEGSLSTLLKTLQLRRARAATGLDQVSVPAIIVLPASKTPRNEVGPAGVATPPGETE